jgi:hypothetical protein
VENQPGVVAETMLKLRCKAFQNHNDAKVTKMIL